MQTGSWRRAGVGSRTIAGAAASLTWTMALGLVACSGPSAEQRGGAHGGSGKLPAAALDTSDVREDIPTLPGVGARCKGGICACREVDLYGRGTAPESDLETSLPPEGHKRYEFRTGRGNDTMRISIEGVGTFVKTGPLPEAACVYVDLPVGTFRVRYHVTAANPTLGAEPRLRISEYSPRWKRWYRTFGFRCADGEQACTKNMAADYFELLAKQRDGKFDPCGSTKVQGLRFWTDREPEQAVGEFNLQLVLNVYKFDPRFPPEAGRCSGPSPDAKAGQPATAPDEGMSVQSAPSPPAPSASPTAAPPK